MRLVGCATAHDGANCSGDLFRHDVGDGAGSPPLHELALYDTPRLGALLQAGGMALQKLTCNDGECIHLAPFCLGTLTRFFHFGVDPFADELEPSPRLPASLLKRNRANLPNRAPGWILRVGRVASDQHEAFMPAIRDAQCEPRHDHVGILVPLPCRRTLARIDKPIGEIVTGHVIKIRGNNGATDFCALPCRPTSPMVASRSHQVKLLCDFKPDCVVSSPLKSSRSDRLLTAWSLVRVRPGEPKQKGLGRKSA